MKRILYPFLTIAFALSYHTNIAQLPDTEIHLADVSKNGDAWVFGTAENITHRVGYDNQPSFCPDGKSLLYVQVEDSTQSDVIQYNFKDKSVHKITNTSESEYSPAYTPDHSKIGVVRVDQDSAQRFYTFDPSNPADITFIEGSDSIGYYCWLNDSLLAMFIVGEKHSLQILNVHSHKRNFIRYDIGRCLKLSADKKALLFMDKSDSTQWLISSLSIADFSIRSIVKAMEGNEDFCPLPDGSIIMGSEGKLYIWKSEPVESWTMVKDYQNSIGPFYRITMNNNASKIAFVAYEGKKP